MKWGTFVTALLLLTGCTQPCADIDIDHAAETYAVCLRNNNNAGYCGTVAREIHCKGP